MRTLSPGDEASAAARAVLPDPVVRESLAGRTLDLGDAEARHRVRHLGYEASVSVSRSTRSRYSARGDAGLADGVRGSIDWRGGDWQAYRGSVEAVLDPAPYRPRADKRRRARLLKEFAERVGDPEAGGAPARPRLTAYRQDAVRCAWLLAEAGELRVREVRVRTAVDRAGPILRDNHYGWFERVQRGVSV